MFCLRSWIPILFFLTNASPIYLVLFISATYVLNRPCVYCSLLLAILVLSLFDFHTDDWFEPRYKRADSQDSFFSAPPARPRSSATGGLAHHHHGRYNNGTVNDAQMVPSVFNASMIIPDGLLNTVALLTALVNNSVASAMDSVVTTAKAALPSVVGGMGSDQGAVSGGSGAVLAASSGFQEWAKALLRKEWRIECLDLVIRL